MEAQEPSLSLSEKEAKRRRAKSGDGGIAFFALRAEIAGELDRKVPMSRIYAKHRLRLGISYRQFIRLAANTASRPGARQTPRRCLCRKARRNMSGLLRTRKIGGRGPGAGPAASELQRARAPVLPRRKAPATSISTRWMPTTKSTIRGRPAGQAGAKQRGTSSRPRVSTGLAIV